MVRNWAVEVRVRIKISSVGIKSWKALFHQKIESSFSFKPRNFGKII